MRASSDPKILGIDSEKMKSQLGHAQEAAAQDAQAPEGAAAANVPDLPEASASGSGPDEPVDGPSTTAPTVQDLNPEQERERESLHLQIMSPCLQKKELMPRILLSSMAPWMQWRIQGTLT